ncbi:MAG TPA: RES domain-containing protein [Terriglobia bacterium]|jgi:RES domain-containing protein|nr:RES domain-containing protein [Terriglobia bacterium]
MRAFRIADRRHPIFDGTGARLAGGRWNSPGRAVIYCAETFAGALLEVLVHANLGRIPRTQSAVEVTIPGNVAMESVPPEAIPGWDAADRLASRAVGDQWLAANRSAVLLVPSLVVRAHERNVLINPAHPDFHRISASEPREVIWDERLFQRRSR